MGNLELRGVVVPGAFGKLPKNIKKACTEAGLTPGELRAVQNVDRVSPLFFPRCRAIPPVVVPIVNNIQKSLVNFLAGYTKDSRLLYLILNPFS